MAKTGGVYCLHSHTVLYFFDGDIPCIRGISEKLARVGRRLNFIGIMVREDPRQDSHRSWLSTQSLHNVLLTLTPLHQASNDEPK